MKAQISRGVSFVRRLSAVTVACGMAALVHAPAASAACDPATEVSFGGYCYYLDGSAGVCDPGYELGPQSILTTIAGSFAGKTYRHQFSFNCCIYNSEPDEDWGMDFGVCNEPGPFPPGNPLPGGAGCTDATNLFERQLTLCVSSTPLASCGDTVLDPTEQCDDGNQLNGDCCSSICQFESDAVTCRASAGDCDPAETCTGASASCPADAKSSAICRPAAGDCDFAEQCDGVADTCPANLRSTAVCRAAADQCDATESCNGLIDSCPADADQPNGTDCDDGTVCTQTDTCQSGTCSGADPLDCDDATSCTSDACDPVDGCTNTDAPSSGCLTSLKSIVLLKDSDDDTKDKLLWKWIKGGEYAQSDLGDPTSSDSYRLCVYAGPGNVRVADAALPSGAGWQAVGTKGYKFKGTSPQGLELALLKGGAAGKSKALTKGKGTALPDPTLPLAYPVIVQLKMDGSPLCLESTFGAGDEVKNVETQFKAKQ